MECKDFKLYQGDLKLNIGQELIPVFVLNSSDPSYHVRVKLENDVILFSGEIPLHEFFLSPIPIFTTGNVLVGINLSHIPNGIKEYRLVRQHEENNKTLKNNFTREEIAGILNTFTYYVKDHCIANQLDEETTEIILDNDFNQEQWINQNL